MLLSAFDDTPIYDVVPDDRQGLHILLLRRDPNDLQAAPTPLCGMKCGDRDSFNAAYRWFAVRRALWQDWGRQIEEDRAAYTRHMAELMSAEPIGVVQASIVRAGSGPRTLELGELVASPAGLRSEILYRHTFATPGKRKRFFEWFQLNAGNGSVERLIDMAVSQGTAVLGNLLDEIACRNTGNVEALKAA